MTSTARLPVMQKKKTELQIIQDKIVISKFKNILLKTTKEKFDSNEIEEYFKMAVDDYNANNLSLSSDDTIKWLEYKIISIAYTVIGLNKLKKLFIKKAGIYKNKCHNLEKKK